MSEWRLLVLPAALIALLLAGPVRAECGDSPTDRPVYLSFDSGHMGIAARVAEVLGRQHVTATFFLARERAADGGDSLDDDHASWWSARAAEGHAFGALDRASSAARICAASQATAARFHAMTGRVMPKLFRVATGQASTPVVAAAEGCDWVAVPGSVSLGGEVAGRKGTNRQLVERALRDVRPGDVLRGSLGSASRQDAWTRANLEPLIEGLKARGLCFATLRGHPSYRGQFAW